jgi:hypothetical protein
MKLSTSGLLVALMFIGLTAERAVGQEIAPKTAATDFIYTGFVPFPDGERCVELEVTRKPLVVRSGGKDVVRGWAFSGSCDVDSIDYYGVFGTSRSLDDPNASWSDVVLKVENYEDSIVGTFEGTFDSAGYFHAVWRPSENSSAAMVCTLGLLEEDENNYEEGYLDAAFISFWDRFQTALRKRDRRLLAGMVRFPITSSYCTLGDWEGDSEGWISRRFLLRHFDGIFYKEATQGLLSFAAPQISTFIVEKEKHGDWGLRVPEGTLIYSLWFNPYSEYSLSFRFAKVNGAYKLIEITCAG